MHYLHARGIGGGGGGLRFEESLSVSSGACVRLSIDYATFRLSACDLELYICISAVQLAREGAFTLLATVPVHKGRNLNDVSTGSGREVPKKQTKRKGGCVIVKLRAVCDLLGEFWVHIAFFSLRRWDTTNL